MTNYPNRAKLHRLNYVDAISTPSREDYQSDEEYRNALIETYNTLRNTQYNYIVLDEATKVYNIAQVGKSHGQNENSLIWNDGYMKFNSDALPVDTFAVSRAPEIARTVYGTKRNISGEYASCAITAVSLASQCSGEMGYDGNENIIQVSQRPADVNSIRVEVANGSLFCCPTNSVSAKDFCATQSIKDHCYKYGNSVTLQELMSSGEIKVGDMVSIKTKSDATNTTSGYHAITIADIAYDTNGNVTHYTVHENNPRGLKTYPINSQNGYANYKVNTVSHMNDIMNEKISEETNGKSIEELEQMISSTKEATIARIESLHESETLTYNEGYQNSTRYTDNDNYAKIEAMNATMFANNFFNNKTELEFPEITDDFVLGNAPDYPTDYIEQNQPHVLGHRPKQATTESVEEQTPPPVNTNMQGLDLDAPSQELPSTVSEINIPELKVEEQTPPPVNANIQKLDLDVPSLELPSKIPEINLSELQSRFNKRVDTSSLGSKSTLERDDVATTMKDDYANAKPKFEQLNSNEIPVMEFTPASNEAQAKFELRLGSRKTPTTAPQISLQQLQLLRQNSK